MTDVPFLRVGVDPRGSACWEVVVPGQAVSQFASGLQAIRLLRALSAAKGGPRPEADT
jgi:hypothetical protein